jgi:hypothetical protein
VYRLANHQLHSCPHPNPPPQGGGGQGGGTS